jgi:NAD(P)-dependent dehydrogenase (short-subunit alcohol dehydrogenase family)
MRQSVATARDEARARKQWASYTLLDRLAAAREIGEAVLLAASPRATFVTGSVIMADGGATAGRRV